MRVAILYICTGNYSLFWDEFYNTAKKKFLATHQKHFFVFTDDISLLKSQIADVTFIEQKKLGWPFDSLYRFKFFLGIEKLLKKFDYTYYINANAIIVSEINDEVFPDPYSFIGSHHPGHYNKQPIDFIYDRNPDSLAYVEYGKGEHYVMGAFIGGKSNEFLQMCKQLNENIDMDFKKNIIALWHDESHYNKYLFSKSYKLLSPSYVYPEEMTLPFTPKIVLRDKAKYGGHNKLRSVRKNLFISELIKCIFKRSRN